MLFDGVSEAGSTPLLIFSAERSATKNVREANVDCMQIVSCARLAPAACRGDSGRFLTYNRRMFDLALGTKRRRVAPVAGALALVGLMGACSSFSSSADGTSAADGGTDAGSAETGAPADSSISLQDALPDGPALDCSTSNAFFCATFDDGATFYGSGLKHDMTTNAERRQPAVSAPNALWFSDSKGGLVTYEGNTTATVLDATFQLRLAKLVNADDAPLLQLGIRIPAYGTCYVTLQANVGALILQSHCGQTNQNPNIDVLKSLPASSDFVSVHMVADFKVGHTTITFNKTSSTTLEHNATEPGGGKPVVSFGADEGMGATEIGYDDMLITAQ